MQLINLAKVTNKPLNKVFHEYGVRRLVEVRLC